ncbi:MAG: DUF1501 domain-containing protein [Vicinamibacterales bacterium]
MPITRRTLLRRGLTTLAVGAAAPRFLCDLALAQGATARNLVVVYLAGGNDALSTVIPYTDPAYYSRRPNIGVPAGTVLQIGRDANGREMGLHPRLTGLEALFDSGRVAIVQRTGYANSSRSHFEGSDIWGTANPQNASGTGWLGRYLDGLPSPVHPLIAWNTARETPGPLIASHVGVPAIASPSAYTFASPNGGTEAQYEREAAARITGHMPSDRPHLAFVNGTAQSALATLDDVTAVAAYQPSVAYPAGTFGQSLQAVAGAMHKGLGTRIFWVVTGGFDTHAGQGVNQGTYANLMGGLNDGLSVFCDDLRNQGLFDSTLVLVYSEFGRRITENGSGGTDHGAAGVMLLLGGRVRGGLHGTAPELAQATSNPFLENNGQDVTFETDFRQVYATVIDNWLGADSTAILGGNFRGGPAVL